MWLNPVLNEDNVSGTLNTNIRVSATENQDVCTRIILKNLTGIRSFVVRELDCSLKMCIRDS